MAGLRYCQDGGLLVGGKERLPTDEHEYFRHGVGYPGCNRIRCDACGAMVRIGPPGVRPRREDEPNLDLQALYAADDWLALPFIEKDDDANRDLSWRLYVCKCRKWDLTNTRSLVNDGDSPSDPNVPWACAGHTVPDLPVTLGELTVADDSDWPALAAKILGGACPRPLQIKSEGPAYWLSWLYVYLRGLPAAEKLAAAIAERVDDANPLVVGRVCSFFWRFPRAAGMDRVLAGDPLAGAAPPEGGRYTRWDVMRSRLWQRSQPPDRIDERAVEMFRELALKPASPDVVADALGDYVHRDAFDADDLSWIAHNLVAMETAAPGRWKPAMGLLVHWGRAKRDLAYLIAIGGVALIESGRVPLADIGDWLRKTSYKSDEWALVLQASLDKHHA